MKRIFPFMLAVLACCLCFGQEYGQNPKPLTKGIAKGLFSSRIAFARSQFAGMRIATAGFGYLDIGTSFNHSLDAQVMSEYGMVMSGSMTKIAPVFIGWCPHDTTTTGDFDFANPLVIAASVELVPGSTPTLCSFRNQRVAVLDPGATLVADPIQVIVPSTVTTAPISAGATVSIPVRSSANFQVGQTIDVGSSAPMGGIIRGSYSLIGGGALDTPKITAIADSTHVTVNTLLYPHASGVKVNSCLYTRTWVGLLPSLPSTWPGTLNASALQPYTGVAEAAGSNNTTAIQLSSNTPNELANASSGTYMVYIVAGTGQGQYGTIASYVALTNIATLTATWVSSGNNGSAGSVVAPDNTSVYTILSSATTAKIPAWFAGGPAMPGDLTSAPYLHYNGTNQTAGAFTAGNAQGSPGFGPVTILGDVATPVICELGDSIAAGLESTQAQKGGGHQPGSPIGLAYTGSYGVFNVAESSSFAHDYATGGWFRRLSFAQAADVDDIALGTNDYPTRTVSQIETDITSIFNSVTEYGALCTISSSPPRTTSTDQWTTVTNQTFGDGAVVEWERQEDNKWRRSNLLGFYAVCDRSSDVEGTNISNTPGLPFAGNTPTSIVGGTTTSITVNAFSNPFVCNPAVLQPGLIMCIGNGTSYETQRVSTVTGSLSAGYTVVFTSAFSNNYSTGGDIYSVGTWIVGPNVATNAAPTNATGGSTTTIVDTVNLPTESSFHFLGLPIWIVQGGTTTKTVVTSYSAGSQTITFSTAVGSATTSANTTYTLFQPTTSLAGSPAGGLHPSDYGNALMAAAWNKISLPSSGLASIPSECPNWLAEVLKSNEERTEFVRDLEFSK